LFQLLDDMKTIIANLNTTIRLSVDTTTTTTDKADEQIEVNQQD